MIQDFAHTEENNTTVEMYPLLPELSDLLRMTFDKEFPSFDYISLSDQMMNLFGYMPTSHLKKYKEYHIDFTNHLLPSYIKHICDATTTLCGKDTRCIGTIHFYYVKYDGDESDELEINPYYDNKLVYMIDGIGDAYLHIGYDEDNENNEEEDNEDEMYEYKKDYALLTNGSMTFDYKKGEYRFIVVNFESI
mgnify:CR=1 FL=1